MSSDPMFFNGINAATGGYDLPDLSAGNLSKLIQGLPVDAKTSQELKQWWTLKNTAFYAVAEGVDEKDLSQSGWGVIFPAVLDKAALEALRDALKPLLDWRKSQAGDLYKEYSGPEGLRPDETKNQWLARHGSGPGPVDPTQVPYYLLLVGDPQQIPYRFQYLLDVQFATGRVYFDTLAEYANYAQSVVEAEKKQLKLARKIALFGVSNPDDPATNLSHTQLVQPLAEMLENMQGDGLENWQYQTVLKEQAKKASLSKLIGGADTPALLFSASHGMCFPNGDSRQFSQQGGLLCQDWPGPRQWRNKPIPQDFYFSSEDLTADANLWGLIGFFFACYGAGTPQLDEFAQQALKNQQAQIAPKGFVARLPQKMLSHPKGGALAVVGHIERAWGYSFMWNQAGRQLEVFRSTIRRLMEGYPVGHALNFFNERYAELSTMLNATLEDIKFGKVEDPFEVAGEWTAQNDARNYVILGDPAVRLMVADKPARAKTTRPSITLKTPQPLVSAPPVVMAPAEIVVTNPKPVDLVGDGAAEYGLRETAASVGQTLETLAKKVGDVLVKAVDEVATLKVYTYTSDSLTGFTPQAGDALLEKAQLRAYTKIQVDGDVVQVVPEQDGVFDTELWQVHLSMVQQAQASRTELIKAAVDAVSKLAGLGEIGK